MTTQVRADNLHRTVKLEIDEGRASTVEEAEKLANTYVLQVDIGGDPKASPALQAAALTTVNAGRRAFLGGVRVRSSADPVLTAGWGRGKVLSEAVESLGGSIVNELSAEHPTLALGEAGGAHPDGLVLHPTWQGWSGGVVEDAAERLSGAPEDALAATLAAAIGVSECFQHLRGNPEAGRRSVGLSLWRPELDWRGPDSFGPEIRYLPSRAWILGLGHLGQAYCWCLGCLPYANPSEVLLYLVDYDVVEDANESTGLLVDRHMIGRTKARAAAERLEELGVRTRIMERAFDPHTRRTANEPTLALAGFDDPQPRRLLEGANFERIIDAGLGAQADHYNEIQLHSFPSSLNARTAFQSRSQPTVYPDQEAYRDLVSRRVDAGESLGDAECGVVEIAGRTVGAAFVGVVAGALVVAEALRILCRGPRYEVVDLSLRSLQFREVVTNEAQRAFVNPGYTLASHY